MTAFRKTTLYVSLLLFTFIILYVGSSVDASSSGKFNASSGCGSCHGASSATVTPTHSGFPSDYTPSQTYLVTIGISTSASGSHGGFSFSVDNGALSNPGSNVQLSGLQATHNSDAARSWSFEWTAPSSGSGQVSLKQLQMQ